MSRTSVSTSAASENPGATNPASGRANSIRTAMPMPPATMMKFATALNARQPPSRSPRPK